MSTSAQSGQLQAVREDGHVQVQRPSAANADEITFSRLTRRSDHAMNVLSLSGIVLACMATFVALFSGMGWGLDVVEFLHAHHGTSRGMLGASAGLALLLYVFDLDVVHRRDVQEHGLHPCWLAARRAVLAASFGCLCIGALLSGRSYPPGPMILYFFSVPAVVFGLRRIWWHASDAAHFLRAMATALTVTFACITVAWLAWVGLGGNSWYDGTLRRRYSERLGCTGAGAGAIVEVEADGVTLSTSPPPPPSLSQTPPSPPPTTDQASTCLVAYLVWCAPVVAATLCLVFAGVIRFVARALRESGLDVPPSTTTRRRSGTAIARDVRKRRRLSVRVTNKVARFFAGTIVIACLGMWVASSVAGAGMGVSNAVVPCIVLALVGVACVTYYELGTTYGWHLREMMDATALHSLSVMVRGDWVRGLMALLGGPFLLLYLALSFVKQQVRVRCKGLALQVVQGAVKGAAEGRRRAGTVADQVRRRASSIAAGGRVTPAAPSTSPTPTTPSSPAPLSRPSPSPPSPSPSSPSSTLLQSQLREERGAWFTSGARAVLAELQRWPWTSVFTKACYWALAYVTLNIVVGKVITVLLSSLNTFLARQGWPLWVTAVAFFGIGVTLLLVPFMPGVPIYLAGGVVLAGAARSSTSSIPLWLVVALASAVSLAIKLCSVTLLNKVAGRRLKGVVAVRKLCAVNSAGTHAIRHILTAGAGSSPVIARVCVLCGGPDWPTAVLTGVLGLPLLPTLLGTLPVVFVVVPCATAGALQLRREEGSGSFATLALASASAMLLLVIVGAVYYIEKTCKVHGKEFAVLPFDAAVAALEQRAKERARAFAEITAWRTGRHRDSQQYQLPLWLRTALLLAWLGAAAAAFLSWFFAADCFEEFEITDTVAEKLGGDATRLVRYRDNAYAFAFLISLGISITCLGIFHAWAMCRMRKGQSSTRPESARATPSALVVRVVPTDSDKVDNPTVQ